MTSSEPLFIGQQALEQWLSDGRAEFTDRGVLLRPVEGGGAQAYRTAPAVRVVQVEAGEDHEGRMGQIYRVAELDTFGGDLAGNSLIVGETAYRCDVGFVALPEAAIGVAPAPGEGSPDASAADLLADYLLKNL